MRSGTNFVLEPGAHLLIKPGAEVTVPWALSWPLPQEDVLVQALQALPRTDVWSALEAACLVLRRLCTVAHQLEGSLAGVAGGEREAHALMAEVEASGGRVPCELGAWIQDAAVRFTTVLEGARVRVDESSCALTDAITKARRWIADAQHEECALPSEIVAQLQAAALQGAASGFCEFSSTMEEIARRCPTNAMPFSLSWWELHGTRVGKNEWFVLLDSQAEWNALLLLSQPWWSERPGCNRGTKRALALAFLADVSAHACAPAEIETRPEAREEKAEEKAEAGAEATTQTNAESSAVEAADAVKAEAEAEAERGEAAQAWQTALSSTPAVCMAWA